MTEPDLIKVTAPSSRATRMQMYADWIRSDADGLLYQLQKPLEPSEEAILTEAIANVKAALSLLEHRAANMEVAQ